MRIHYVCVTVCKLQICASWRLRTLWHWIIQLILLYYVTSKINYAHTWNRRLWINALNHTTKQLTVMRLWTPTRTGLPVLTTSHFSGSGKANSLVCLSLGVLFKTYQNLPDLPCNAPTFLIWNNLCDLVIPVAYQKLPESDCDYLTTMPC